MEEQTAEQPVAVEKPVEIPAAVAGVVKPAEIPVAGADVVKPAEIPAVDDGTLKVNKEEWESTKAAAASFRATQNTESKLKARYAKLEFLITEDARGLPRGLHDLFPETEDVASLKKVQATIIAGYHEWVGSEVAKGRLKYVNLGGSCGGGTLPTRDRPDFSKASAGELLGMRR